MDGVVAVYPAGVKPFRPRGVFVQIVMASCNPDRLKA